MPNDTAELTIFSHKQGRILVFLALLLMLWLGYQLGGTETEKLQNQVVQLQDNVAKLNAENNLVTQQINQLVAQQSVCDAELALTLDTSKSQQEDLTNCNEQVDFYQHVMAPEISQRMLSADLMTAELNKNESSSLLTIELVLLQPRVQKAVISGQLAIALEVEGSEIPVPLSSINYRFKFFQQVKESFIVPEKTKPIALLLSSDVVQYKRVREKFEQRLLWPES